MSGEYICIKGKDTFIVTVKATQAHRRNRIKDGSRNCKKKKTMFWELRCKPSLICPNVKVLMYCPYKSGAVH